MQIGKQSIPLARCLVLALLVIYIAHRVGQTRAEEDLVEDIGPCGMYNDIGKNDLTPIDVVVKNAATNIACIRARFSLAIKVEALIPSNLGEDAARQQNSSSNTTTKANDELRIVLGYLPLEHVLAVEDSCPDNFGLPKPQQQQQQQNPPPTPATSQTNVTDTANGGTTSPSQTTESSSSNSTEPPEPGEREDLEMIVTFECGKLAFSFKRNESCDYLASIKGLVKLDKKVVREFIAVKPMLITSDLEHHFKYDDLIEVNSEPTSKAYILSANLYFTEIETFRSTTSRDFIRPPDEASKPFLNDTDPVLVANSNSNNNDGTTQIHKNKDTNK